MEEIVTVGGKQYKLTTDRPLTALERQQTIAQIQQQTGCSSCHQPRTLSSGFGGIQSLADCSTIIYGEADTVTLSASPADGTEPYYVKFWRKIGTASFTQLGTGVQTVATEGLTATTSFVLTDVMISAAATDSAAGAPTSDTTGAITDPAGGAEPLAAGKIRVATTTYDSCPTTPQTCVEWCDINLTCVAPTCNFVVS